MANTPSSRHAVAAAALAYSVLAIAITFPLVLHLSDAVPHDIGDPLLSTSILWWNAHVTPLTRGWWNGPWFYPDVGALTFSDHRLGASLLASPLQWAGLGAVTAYNLTLLASFTLCATAAFALVLALARRVDAAAVCGLAFGFNPYRMAHIEHLELLLAFGMPLALLALHRYHETRRPRWLAVLAAALVLQGLCSSYYLLFFSVFMALWIAWFMRWSDRRALLAIALASAAAVALLAPIYVEYWRIHRLYGFKRAGFEVEFLSADVTSIVTASPLLALWGWTSHLNGPERQTFPGLTISLLAVAGAVSAGRLRRVAPDRLSRISRACAILAAIVVAIAIAAQRWGPFHVSYGPLRLSIDVLFKPLSVALLLAVGALVLSARMRDAYRRRSRLAFYGIAAAVLFLCTTGHRPKFLGEEILYRPPYAWLTNLPGFSDAVRVPARFAMPAVLALSVAAAFAFAHLRGRRRWPGALLLASLIGIAADGWPRRLPIVPVPVPWHTVVAPDIAAVLELPLGGAEFDSSAMYRGTFHRYPTVNGMSGYLPPHYFALTRALAERDTGALEALGSIGPLLVVTDRRLEEREHWAAFVAAYPGVTPTGDDGHWRFFRLERRPPATRERCGDGTIRRPVAADDGAPVDVTALVDGNPATVWTTAPDRRTRDVVTIDLGAVFRLCGAGFSLGSQAVEYPGELGLEWSSDGQAWKTGYAGSIAARAILAAADQPTDARIELTFEPVDARFLRLHRVPVRDTDRWILAEVYGRGAG